MDFAQHLTPAGTASSSSTQSSTHVEAEHIRGSSVLLASRSIAFGLEFAAQVLLVRYLTKSDFGAFIWALSIIVVFKSVALLELPNTLARFIPVYREWKAYDLLLGSGALAIAVVAALGGLMAAGLYLAVAHYGLKPTDDPQALALLTVLVLLIPLEGLDALLTALFAALAGAAQIAFRQVVNPALKLAIVLALIWTSGDVVFLASGYVIASVLNLLLYAWLLVRIVGKQPWLQEWQPRHLSYPTREIFAFALPLLASALVWLLMESSDAVLLGLFWNTESVASFRAALSIPRVLVTLSMTFSLLYIPLASSLYARGKHKDLADLYRQGALWMTVLAFPIFVLAFGFARSTVTGLYGERYADSAPIMALLSLGCYLFALTGFNGLTLKIYKKLRYAVAVDISVAMLNLAVNLVLISRWGAIGAAVGTAGTMIVHTGLKQYGLWRFLGVNLFEQRLVPTYGAVFVVALAALGLQAALPADLRIALPVSAVASLLVLWVARGALEIESVFPEVQRWPILLAFLRWRRAA